jgi:transcriptional regulator with XRE-family HTH domain
MKDRRQGDPITPDQVKLLREELGMTQSEFADRLGVRGGKSVISTWENGRAACDGPAAELILLLLGSNSLSLGMASLREDMEQYWTDSEEVYSNWRQVAIIPIDEPVISRDQMLSLFPSAALPSDEYAHGFPFVNVSGIQPFSLIADGWMGSLPHNRPVPISYLWRFTSRGGFAYREKLWEIGQELGPTGGHVFVGALFEIVAPAFEFYRRLGLRLGWNVMRLSARLDVAGVRGRGIASYANSYNDISLPERVSFEDKWASTTKVPLPTDQVDVIASSIALIGPVVASVRPEIAKSDQLFKQLIARCSRERKDRSKYPHLAFLKEPEAPGLEKRVMDRIRELEIRPATMPSGRKAQRAVLEYLEQSAGVYQELGADANWAKSLKLSGPDQLADVIWYLAWRGFIEFSKESKSLRPLMESYRSQGLIQDSAPPEFVKAVKDGITLARITTAGGDRLYELRREM